MLNLEKFEWTDRSNGEVEGGRSLERRKGSILK